NPWTLGPLDPCSVLSHPIVPEQDEHLILRTEPARQRASIAVAVVGARVRVAYGIVAVAQFIVVRAADAARLRLRARSADGDEFKDRPPRGRRRTPLPF